VLGARLRVWGFGRGVSVVGFRVGRLGCGVSDVGIRVWGLECGDRVRESGCGD
jgi:hypothetical protein